MGVFVRSALVAIVVLGAACAKGTDAEVGGDVDPDAGPGDPQDGSVLPQKDSGDPVDSSAPDAAVDASDACTEALAKVAIDFESGAVTFTHGASDNITVPPDPTWPYDPWAQGTSSVGTACKSGKCLGTELTKNYAQCHRGYAMSPAIDLSACKGKPIALVFEHAYGTGSYGGQTWFDGGVVEVSGDGTTWTLPQFTFPGTVKINPSQTASYECVHSNAFGVHNKAGYVGAQTVTTKVELPLPATAVTDKMRIRFSTAAGVSSQTSSPEGSRSATAFGWRIDNIGFVAK